MENKTAYAIVEALGEALVRKQEGIDNCLEHIGHLNTVQEKLIADNKKMKEEILSLKSESSAPKKVADCDRFGIAEGADTSEEVCHGVGEMGYCNGDCCPDGSAYDPEAVDG